MLVALVVITVGMLGVAVLYVEGLRMNRTSLYRTAAIAMAADMAERIRANQGTNQGADYIGIGPGQDNNCNDDDMATTCTSQELAADDWFHWLDKLQVYLPAGAGAEITRELSNDMQQFNISLDWPEIGAEERVTYTLTMQL